jgi:hypothetical protein
LTCEDGDDIERGGEGNGRERNRRGGRKGCIEKVIKEMEGDKRTLRTKRRGQKKR